MPSDAISHARSAGARLLELQDPHVIDVVLATLVVNQLAGDPVWLVLVAPPSNGKTEILTAASAAPTTYMLSTLTRHTFISGHRPTAACADPSLLPQLTDKTLILKDFTTLLTLNPNDRMEILGLLREIYDGRVTKTFGTGKAFHWEGTMGLLAGVTPMFDMHSVVHTQLGERFLLWRIHSGWEIREAQCLRAARAAGNEKTLRAEFGQAMLGAYTTALEWVQGREVVLGLPLEKWLSALSHLVCAGRTHIFRDGYSRRVMYVPESEGPGRLFKQLRQLLVGLLALHQRTVPTVGDLRVLRTVAWDSMHPIKAMAFDALGQNPDGLGVREFARVTNLPKTTAQRHLDDLLLTHHATQDDDENYRPHTKILAFMHTSKEYLNQTL